jgi:hypothetical protein
MESVPHIHRNLFFGKMLPKRSSGTQEFMNPGKSLLTFPASWVPDYLFALVAAQGRAMKLTKSAV